MALTQHDRKRLKEDFPLYAKHCLKIKTKAGQIRPLILNRAQLTAHKLAQQQLSDQGKVRQIVLKGRQMGLSTYIEARLFWLVTHYAGRNAYILTHEQAATNNLFDMVERYYDQLPMEMKPSTDRANAKEIKFGKIMSGYKVGTAGARAVGRSSTIQLLHGSEAAFWPHAQEHNAGLMQAIPTGESSRGTEVWMESTANGIGDLFHGMWEDAVSGKSEFKALFAPWFWDDSYAIPVADDFELTPEEYDYAEAFDLYDEQMAWRRHKLIELRDEYLFKQEYPATPEEAFEAAGDRVLIPINMVMRAVHTPDVDGYGPIVVGVDPARFGDDRTGICVRQGRKVISLYKTEKMDTMAVTAEVMEVIRRYSPHKVFVDVIGLGAGVVDRLRELGVPVSGVAASEKATENSRYFNKRAEMWGNIREWLDDIPVSLPDDSELIADLTSLHYEFRVRGGNSVYKLESKEDAKKRGIRSPDLGDALALTFARSVHESAAESFEPELVA